MGLLDKLFGEFVDVIQWTDDSNDTLVYRFEHYGNEIKYGAMLTVREGQTAVLVNEGRLADVFEPGLYKNDWPSPEEKGALIIVSASTLLCIAINLGKLLSRRLLWPAL